MCGRASLFGVVYFKIVHVVNSSLDLRLDRHLHGACALLIFLALARPIDSMQPHDHTHAGAPAHLIVENVRYHFVHTRPPLRAGLFVRRKVQLPDNFDTRFR